MDYLVFLIIGMAVLAVGFKFRKTIRGGGCGCDSGCSSGGSCCGSGGSSCCSTISDTPPK